MLMPETQGSYLGRVLDERIGEFIALRRDLHQHPELAFEEHRTADLVARKLQAWGYEVARGIGGTGVVGTLRVGHGSQRLGMRADMDALPMTETTGLPTGPAARRAACMPAATTATRPRCWPRRSCIGGDARLRWHAEPDLPAGRRGPGGAVRMVDDGLFERFPCDAIFALHNMPGFPARAVRLPGRPDHGVLDTRPSPSKGAGGHGAMPHTRPTRWSRQHLIVMALQTIVSRNVDPLRHGRGHGRRRSTAARRQRDPRNSAAELSVRARRPGGPPAARRITAVQAAGRRATGARPTSTTSGSYAVLVNDAGDAEFAGRQVARTRWAIRGIDSRRRATDGQRRLRLHAGHGAGLLLHRRQRRQAGLARAAWCTTRLRLQRRDHRAGRGVLGPVGGDLPRALKHGLSVASMGEFTRLSLRRRCVRPRVRRAGGSEGWCSRSG
jgi:hippurate hydrolase